MPETFSLLALPWSADPADPFHVSLFVSPRLTPTGTLADFPMFTDWADHVLGARIALTDQTGVAYTVTRVSSPEPTAWAVVFPGDTPVTGWQTTPPDTGRFRSYDTRLSEGLAKAVHVVSMAADPVSPPAPGRSPVAQLVGRYARQYGMHETRHGMVYDESLITERLDRLDRSGGIEPADALWVAVHRVRRFFEAPTTEAERLAAYRERPDENAVPQRLSITVPDFHERVGRLGAQPDVLRMLGLVIDVRVDDTARLAAASSLQARLSIDPFGDVTLPTRVRCRAEGTALVTVARDPQQWTDGRLRVGDTSRFAVLDLDPDASGLKLDRFLWTLPRLSALELAGEPAHAAPPTVRAHGLAVVHAGRSDHLAAELSATGAKDGDLVAGKAPELTTEDVTRGLRVQVWDDTAGRWFSVHERLSTISIAGRADETVANEGFLQPGVRGQADGSSDDVYVHESLFGWTGWSLSAPHPALAIEHQYGGGPATGAERHEELTDPVDPPDPILHLVTRHRVAPGTLPRMRYGRRYAFRAFAVDLAGNSPRAAQRPASATPDSGAPASIDAAAAHLATGRAAPSPLPSAALDFVRSARAEFRALTTPAVADRPDGFGLTAELADALAHTDPAVAALVAGRIDAARRDRAPRSMSRRELVTRAMSPVLLGDAPPLAATAGWSAESFARVVQASTPVPDGVDTGALAALVQDTVTALRPLLRWRPVDPPVVVARRHLTEGESLRHLVIRSGVHTTRDRLLGDTVTVVDPVAYGAEVELVKPGLGYANRSERHLAAPKVDQVEAELHGRFDDAIGSSDSAKRLAALLAARRESGTFFSDHISSLTDPAVNDTLPYVDLVDPPVTDPTTLATLADAQKGLPLAPGQYVVHDTDEACLPYLADPLAAGVSFVFPEAGTDRPLTSAMGIEGVTVPYAGPWPEPAPLRLVLEDGAQLHADSDDRTVRFALAPSDVQRIRLASSLRPDELDLFGLWRSLPPTLHDDPVLAAAAADGWLWGLTPGEDLTLVHAVPKPLEAPRPTLLAPQRTPGDTGVALVGAVDVHGPSTEHLACEATWTEQVDDITRPAPSTIAPMDLAFDASIGIDEDLALLWAGPSDVHLDVPGFGPVTIHAARHELRDTRHRTIDYTFRASTRFREYFHPSLFTTPDDSSVVGPTRTVSVPSSARPGKPIVRQVLPLFRWSEETEPEQPFALRRRRRAGLRLYLDRPWFSSGDGELLAVLLAPGANEVQTEGYVSQWASDPIWAERHVARRPLFLELDHVLHELGLDDRERPARPVGPAVTLPLVDHPAQAAATVLGYRPHYEPERKLWYVDIALDPQAAAWPFVRLRVARYQPDSLPGMHLSPVVTCDFVQVPPERTAMLARPDALTARVVVTGPIVSLPGTFEGGVGPAGLAQVRQRIAASRRVLARLERKDPVVPGDLGWTTIATEELQVQGFDAATSVVSFVGELTLPEPLAPARPPSGSGDLRVTVEEIELIDSDPDPSMPPTRQRRPVQPRLVYADHLPL